jgi:arginine/lysine/ornithine decarboxylase
MTIYEAMTGIHEDIDMEDAEGRIPAEIVCIYPPDIPVLIPGEAITKEAIDQIRRAEGNGSRVTGLYGGRIRVVKQ